MSISVISCASLVFFFNDMTSGYGRHSVKPGYRPMGLRGGVKYARHFRSGGDELPENAAVYVFGDEELSEDEICNEDMIELLTRNRHSRTRRSEEDSVVAWVEISAKEGDTLTNIALKYSCKVADLKRLNKLINDQDFYGLKRIRIPVLRHGVLEEQIQMEGQESAHNDHSRVCIESNESHLLDSESVASLTLSSQNSQGQQAQQLLLRYDQDIQDAMNSAQLEQSNAGTVLRAPLSRQLSKTLSWRTVLVFFAMFCVIIPIVGGLYVILKHFLGYS